MSHFYDIFRETWFVQGATIVQFAEKSLFPRQK